MVPLNVWGPAAWQLLHSIAHCYQDEPTEEQRRNMLTFLNSLCGVLPCSRCSAHCHEYMALHLHESTVASRRRLVTFLHEFHNSVNERTGKPVLSMEEHDDVVRGWGAKKTPPPRRACFYAKAQKRAAIVAIVAVLFLHYLRTKRTASASRAVRYSQV